MTLTTAVDDDAGTLAQGLGVTGFPTVYYVDATGTVVNVTVGESPAGAIEANLDALQGSDTVRRGPRGPGLRPDPRTGEGARPLGTAQVGRHR